MGAKPLWTYIVSPSGSVGGFLKEKCPRCGGALYVEIVDSEYIIVKKCILCSREWEVPREELEEEE